jgi:signal transduction histidine kinase/ActR/RegA family two-component response regulator
MGEFQVHDTAEVLKTLHLPPDAGRVSQPVRETKLFGQPILEFAEPVYVEEGLAGVLRYGLTTRSLVEALATARASQATMTKRALWTFALGSLCIVALGVYFARRTAEKITQPLQQLTEAAKRFAGGEHRVAVTVRSGDELQLLGDAFNQMVSDLERSYRVLEAKNRELESEIEQRKRAQNERTVLQNSLAQSQKMEAFGQLAGGVAHDFNNILAVVIGNTELVGYSIEDHHLPPEIARLNQDIRAAAMRGAGLTRQLLTFARREVDNPRLIDVNDTLQAFSKLIRRMLEESVELEVSPGKLANKVRIDPGRLEQVLMNLCVNARDAMPRGGKLQLATGQEQVAAPRTLMTGVLEPGDYIWLKAKDQGSGIPADVLGRIFEPFFTTKAAGQGTGLGLAMVHSIVQVADGLIEVETSEKGTLFQIYLPVASGANDEATARAVQTRRNGDGSRILLCEDEPGVRLMTRRILERSGYHVTEVGAPAEAVAALRLGSFELLLTDVVMPGMNGPELADEAQKIAPNLALLYMSGYTGGVLAARGIGDDSIHLLRKPFEPNELLDRVEAVLSRRRA